MNSELIRYLKIVKRSMVDREMTGEDWEERQQVIQKLEEAVTYLNDCSARDIEFDVVTKNIR